MTRACAAILMLILAAPVLSADLLDSAPWTADQLLGLDAAQDAAAGSDPALDLLSLYLRPVGEDLQLRLSLVRVGGAEALPDGARFLILFEGEDGRSFGPGGETLPEGYRWEAGLEIAASDLRAGRATLRALGARGEELELAPEADIRLERDTMVWRLERDALGDHPLATALFGTGRGDRPSLVIALQDGREVDRLLAEPGRDYRAHCALMHHGNQSLTYTDVFHGRWDDPDGSGFDETLEVHEAAAVPGNFHLSGPLQSSADWDHQNGDPVDFNGWLADGVSAGWAGMIASAYAQHIMPFVEDSMNDWAVHTHVQMTLDRYGYFPTVAWVPERVWLTPGVYPDQGVIDAIADDFLDNGVQAVILDDNVHCSGYDKHQIHTIAGTGLKVIPRDDSFTGRLHAGDGGGALSILTGLADSGLGDFRLVTYADDWEMAGEIGEWANSMPQAKETYDWFVWKCHDESAWLSVWKLSDAVNYPNFQGLTINLSNGTYWSIGGTDGYGGGNNGWYPHWASWIPWVTGGNGSGYCGGSGGSCQNYGDMWSGTWSALMAAPGGPIAEAGWYALMTNLYETAWHDGQGGPISGWEHNHSAHMKNGRYFAEAAHWGAGEWASPELNAYTDDVDGDGYDEMVIHNQRLMAVIESNGGRIVHLSARDGDEADTVVGVDNAYWYGTLGDYNDGNHIAALSEVVPDQQGLPFEFSVDAVTADSVQVTLSLDGFSKTLILRDDEPFLRVLYSAGDGNTYVKSGFSPSLATLIWDSEMQRVWDPQGDYMGFRNPSTGLFGGYVLGDGGASHLSEFSGRLMKGDELSGDHRFEFWLYAGWVSEPASGQVAELEALAPLLQDVLPPLAESCVYFPGLDQLRLDLDQEVSLDALDPSGISIDDDGDGLAELTLSLSTSVQGTGWEDRVDLVLTPDDAAVLEGLDTESLTLLLAAGTCYDESGLGNPALTAADAFPVFYGPPTQVIIDGNIDHGEWSYCQIALDDPDNDSTWSLFNELQTLYMTADESYLYLGMEGRLESQNSWLIHMDADYGMGTGQNDLRFLPWWDRNAQFTYPGTGIDFLYGSYGGDDGSFYSIDGMTSMTDLSDQGVILATDLGAGWPGSELAIPWDLLYGMGENALPAGAVLGLSCAIAWDEELGGDVMPNNAAAELPVVDMLGLLPLDLDGDGLPDLPDHEAPLLLGAETWGDEGTELRLAFNEAMDPSTAANPAFYHVHESLLVDEVLEVSGAAFGESDSIVILDTEQQENVDYTVRVFGLRDASCYLNTINPNTSTTFEGPVTAMGEAPLDFGLSRNWPNPFNPVTRLEFTLARDGAVDLAIYDVTGRRLATLARGDWEAGVHRVTWQGRDESGKRLSSGVYFALLRSVEGTQKRKMLLLK